MIDLNHFDGHTPGPWRVNPNQPEYVWSNDSQTICQAFGWASNVSHPNAKLIAAAPDLLAECKRQAEEIKDIKTLLAKTMQQNARIIDESTVCTRNEVIAWEVCASIHKEYAIGKDPIYKRRQSDFLEKAKRGLAKLEGENYAQ